VDKPLDATKSNFLTPNGFEFFWEWHVLIILGIAEESLHFSGNSLKH